MEKLWVVLAVVALLGGCAVFERVTVTATGFSIPRNTNYPTLSLENVTLQDDEPHTVSVEARCVEDTVQSQPTIFSATVVLEPNQPKTLQIPYEEGSPVFTDSRVECRFVIETTSVGGPQIDFVFTD